MSHEPLAIDNRLIDDFFDYTGKPKKSWKEGLGGGGKGKGRAFRPKREKGKLGGAKGKREKAGTLF